MDHPDYRTTQRETPFTRELLPWNAVVQQQPPINGPTLTTDSAAHCTPLQQSHHIPNGAYASQGPLTQPPQPTTFEVPVQPTLKQDHMTFSIFTTVCCFLPLGLVALFYSIKTQDANRIGNDRVAQETSRRARFFARISCGVGTVSIIAIVLLFAMLRYRLI